MIIFIGDVHGDFSALNSFMNKQYFKHRTPITFIQCGDCAYFWVNEPTPKIKVPHKCKLIWIPGNHEDWEKIDMYERGKLHELQDNVFLATFGAMEIIDGYNTLFCGGADSVDKRMRYLGIDWFPQEIIDNNDMNFLFDKVEKKKVDILVSHTCPSRIFKKLKDTAPWLEEKSNDPSTFALDIIVDTFNPDLSVFGHFHIFQEGKIKDLRWTCLGYIYSNHLYFKILKE